MGTGSVIVRPEVRSLLQGWTGDLSLWRSTCFCRIFRHFDCESVRQLPHFCKYSTILVCRTLLCETQTDRKVQTIFGPQGGALNPSGPSGILVFWKDKWHCSNEDQASEHWKAIWKTKGLQICNQDPRLSQKQYFVATHPYEQRATMMKPVTNWIEPKIPTVPCRSISYSRNQCAEFGYHRSWRGWFEKDVMPRMQVQPSNRASSQTWYTTIRWLCEFVCNLALYNDWAFEFMTLCIVSHVFRNQLKVRWFHALPRRLLKHLLLGALYDFARCYLETWWDKWWIISMVMPLLHPWHGIKKSVATIHRKVKYSVGIVVTCDDLWLPG